MRRAVFLDRDDTLIENASVTAGTAHPGDLFDASLVRLMPGVAEGCRRLRGAGYALVVVSNQGCVARGVCTTSQVEAVNARMVGLLDAGGVKIDGVYYCPWHPGGGTPPYDCDHPWRKPAPGMLLAAGTDLGLDLSTSWLIGDSERDVQAAVAAGIAPARAVLVGRGVRDFSRAADYVLRGG